MVSFIEFRMLEICKKCASQQGRVQKNAFCYISIKSQHKKIVDFSLEFVRKSINNEFSMNLQADHFSKNVHTSLTGRPKMKKLHSRVRGVIENWFWHSHAAWEAWKNVDILLEICVKVDFWNTSRARTSKIFNNHDEQLGQNHGFRTSKIAILAYTTKTSCFTRVFFENFRISNKWKCCSPMVGARKTSARKKKTKNTNPGVIRSHY